MALRAGYKGFKKLLPGLKIIRPGTLGIDNDVLIPELNKTFFPRSEQAVLGAKNLLPFPYYDKTTTVDDGTITVNADGSVTCDGTFTNGANFELWANANFVHDKALLFNGCPSGGEINNKYGVQIYTTAHTSNPLNDVGNGDVSIDANDTITRIVIIIRAGQVLSNLTFYPMLRLATDTDPTYVPYAMTNRGLTENLNDLSDKVGLYSGFKAAPNSAHKVRLSFNNTYPALFLIAGKDTSWAGYMIILTEWNQTVNAIKVFENGDFYSTLSFTYVDSKTFDIDCTYAAGVRYFIQSSQKFNLQLTANS